MKTRTTGSSTPFMICETRMIRSSGAPGSRIIPRRADDERGVEPVELGRLAEVAVDPRLEAEALADAVGGRQRQDRGGEERGVGEAEGEEPARVAPGQRGQGARRVRAGGDLVMPSRCSVAAQATTMKKATTTAMIEPRITSSRTAGSRRS